MPKINLLVVCGCLLSLGVLWTFLIQTLPSTEGDRRLLRAGLQDKRLAQLQAATEQERHLVAQTQQLADQVEQLSKQLQAASISPPPLLQIHTVQSPPPPPPHTPSNATTTTIGQALGGQEGGRTNLNQIQNTQANRAVARASQRPLQLRPREEWEPLLVPTKQDDVGQHPALDLQEVNRRREKVREAARHSWTAYEAFAWGKDELMPLSHGGKDSFGGIGATLVDSLDTLWLLGMRDAFHRAREWVATSLHFTMKKDVSVFETTIRIVGGLLSAHQLSGDQVFADKAEELMHRLIHAFSTPSGVPWNMLNLATLAGSNPSWTLRSSTLSEFGTEQLESIALSHVTGNRSFADKSEAVVSMLADKYPGQGLLPVYFNPTSSRFTTNKVSVGAMGDSYYEYLLKVWLMKGKPENSLYRDMWERAMDDMIAGLLFKSEPSGLKYIADYDRGKVKHKMDHLVCFLPALLALGVQQGAVQGLKGQQYLSLAEDLTYTCWKMYSLQPSGLSPEYVKFVPGQDMVSGVHYYLLRPEAMEAMFVMWRVTKQEKYRSWAWEMFSAMERHCKVEVGYTGVKDVRQVPCEHDDTMQSFWLAELLKYAWLIFAPDDVLSLDVWVLNTEAHPLRIIGS